MNSLLGAPTRGFAPFKAHSKDAKCRIVLSRTQRPFGPLPGSFRGVVRAAAAAPTTQAPPAAATVSGNGKGDAAAVPGNGTAAGGLVKDAPTFQEAISKLQQYWASVGCAIWLPHNTEVGQRLPDRQEPGKVHGA